MVSDAAGQASVVTVNADGAGSRMVMLGTTVNFRNHPIGSYQWIGRSMEWLAPEGAAVEAPAPSATDPGPSAPTEPSQPAPDASDPAAKTPQEVAPTGGGKGSDSEDAAGGTLPSTGADVPVGPMGIAIALLLAASTALGLRHRQQLRRAEAEIDG